MRTGVLLVVLAAACSHAQVRPFVGPDGHPGWFHITCPSNDGDCLRLAGERCPGGWDVHDHVRHEDERVGVVATSSGALASSRVERSSEMVVHCAGAIAGCPRRSPACETSNPRPARCDEEDRHILELGCPLD